MAFSLQQVAGISTEQLKAFGVKHAAQKGPATWQNSQELPRGIQDPTPDSEVVCPISSASASGEPYAPSRPSTSPCDGPHGMAPASVEGPQRNVGAPQVSPWCDPPAPGAAHVPAVEGRTPCSKHTAGTKWGAKETPLSLQLWQQQVQGKPLDLVARTPTERRVSWRDLSVCSSPVTPLKLSTVGSDASWEENASSWASSSASSPRHTADPACLHMALPSPRNKAANSSNQPPLSPAASLHDKHMAFLGECSGGDREDAKEELEDEVIARCLNFEEVEEDCKALAAKKKQVEGLTIVPMSTRFSRATGEEYVVYALHVEGDEGPVVPGGESVHKLLPTSFKMVKPVHSVGVPKTPDSITQMYSLFKT